MKVLQIVKTSEGATWAFEQAKWLKENNVEVVTVIPNATGNIAKKYILNKMRIIIADFSLPISTPWKFFKKRREILEIIEKEKPDIIHMHFVTNVLMVRITLKNKNIPKLFQVPGPLHLESKFFRKLEIKLSNQYDFWLPSCKKSEKIYINEGINPEKVFLAYYGGATNKEYQESKNILHTQYNIPKENVLIGMVSYFYKPKWYLGQKRGIKGHEDFIDAIEILNKKYNNITAVIIGGAWNNSSKYEQKVKEYANKKKINNIIFTGFRNDIKEIYKEIDIAVHPSHSENLGGAAESLAAGVPTIATNIGGFPDIITDGETGLLCEVKNSNDLASKIEKMIIDYETAKEIAKKGQAKVQELLNINNTGKRILNIYKRILKEW